MCRIFRIEGIEEASSECNEGSTMESVGGASAGSLWTILSVPAHRVGLSNRPWLSLGASHAASGEPESAA